MVPITVYSLVDWNSQIHAANPPESADEVTKAFFTLKFVVRRIESALSNISSTQRYRLRIRLYHGWRKGFEATVRRKAIIRVLQDYILDDLSRSANISVDQSLEFGDDLTFASNLRRHQSLSCHLPNTLRNSISKSGIEEEKLVDTALASDLVALSVKNPGDFLMVVGEDDDLIPPLLTAEYLRQPADAPVRIIRSRGHLPFYLMDGLAC